MESNESKYNLLEELSALTVKTHKELEVARQELTEKELQLMEIAKVSHDKILQVAKTNQDLKQKVDFFQELSNTLDEKNQELNRALVEIDTQKTHYAQLIKKYKHDLEKLAEREKDLEIQRHTLANTVEEKTSELLQAQRTASLIRVSSRLANGLRNPINIIKNGTGILRQSKNLTKQELEVLLKVEKASNRMSFQIEEVLDFVSQSEIFLKRYSINELLDSTINGLEIPLTVKITRNSCDVILNCDKRKMVSVFSNLITNASDAMSGKGEIKIKATENETDLEIKIQDTGPGIGKSNINKVFDPLYTTKDTGTGLGLSICRGIIEQHGGAISVSSPPTVFKITIPKNLRGFYKASDPKLAGT